MTATLFTIIVHTLWLFLPAGIANTAPVIAARYGWWPVLAVPLDGGAKLRGHRMLGHHKTLRGVVLGIIFGSITGLIQYFLVQTAALQSLELVPFSSPALALGWGAVQGCGALLGDAAKSFFKRQFNIDPGASWRPFDQIDFILGAIVLSYWWHPLPLRYILTAIILFGFITYFISIIGVMLNIKEEI